MIKPAQPQIIFFGNGPLADFTLEILKNTCDIVFHARSREDLTEVKRLKSENPLLHGVLASYGVIIREDVLNLFEPEGILNIHPSLLPEYRGPSPIETAIRDGKTTFGISVMKLEKAMDAGPLYYQTAFDFDKTTEKSEIYEKLAKTGAAWIADQLALADAQNKPLNDVVTPAPQQGEPTFTKMLDKSLSPLDPSAKTAEELLDEIRAYQGFPKSKYDFYGLDCTIIKAHVLAAENSTRSVGEDASRSVGEDASRNVGEASHDGGRLILSCKSNTSLCIDELQPAGRKVMDAKSFINGYVK